MYERVRRLLVLLYGESVGERVFDQVAVLIENFRAHILAARIKSEVEIERLVKRALAHGGRISYKTERDREYPYELNINYFDALNAPNSGEPMPLQISRFLAAHAILLSLQGVPGIYFHSLFGLRGWPEGVAQTGQNRTINRQKFLLPDIENRRILSNARRRFFPGCSIF